MPGKYHDIATRAQVLTLKVIKCPDAENTKITGLPRSTINSIHRTARARGYNPDACQTIFNSYVEDAPKSGAPLKATPEVEDEGSLANDLPILLLQRSLYELYIEYLNDEAIDYVSQLQNPDLQ